MEEQDSTVEDQTPPPGFEPQPDLQSANAGIEEREPDLVEEAEEELPNVGDDPDGGDADGEDDGVEDAEDHDDN